ncbi:MAG: TonB-dependent receptor, partial [Bacteroidetes bacterium]|nr:TonB-dependent receptor [Bacteroidota bacterium]
LLYCCISLFPLLLHAQNTVLKGVLSDAETQETLIGATVLVGSQGTVTDLDGNYQLTLKNGNYDITFSYVGYEPQVIAVSLTGGTYDLNVNLRSSQYLKEIVIVSDIAVERETPVAFSNISSIKLQEELASQDLPMVLNSTPGTYATQTGGGDGDARITIRGFDQRNLAVMLDGIPVNDMENGWVYWSNWFGLDLVTKTMQVQRGLGASKLSIPSVGGTINILTKGIESKKSLSFQQEVGSGSYFRSTLGYTSGRLRNGWGISLAASYKNSKGWVDGTYSKGYFYYFRIDKEMGKHMLSLSGFGAPQEHGQRSYDSAMEVIDVDYAKKHGVPDSLIENYIPLNMGRRYNQHIGILNGNEENTAINYYHKPQFSLRHSWQVTPKTFLSNVIYLSVGKGGGVNLDGSHRPIRSIETGLYDLDEVYTFNQSTSLFKPDKNSEEILRASNNDHFWYGLLSTVRTDISQRFAISGGIDLRSYRGDHYRSVYDLMGGEYYKSTGNYLIDQKTTQLHEGDKYDYNNSAFVRWAGVFGLVEYKTGPWATFLNLSGASTGYRLEDYFKPKVVELADTSFFVTNDQPVLYHDVLYTINSEEAKIQQTDWIVRPSLTIKFGASYDINDDLSVFVNLGNLSRATRFTNVINDNRFGEEIIEVQDPQNEKVQAAELGLGYGTEKFSANINAYYTNWKNKPFDFPIYVLEDPNDPESDRVQVNVFGIGALHKGIEFDFAYNPIPKWSFEGLMSLGNWTWNSKAEYFNPFEQKTESFDPRGVRVGDAAQTQIGGLVRYEPIKGLYFKLRGTYFDNFYADFRPEDLQYENAQRQSWKVPTYYLFDLNTGYSFKVSKDIRLTARFNVLNLFDTVYISDAQNNNTNAMGVTTENFDAASASVFFGQGRRYNFSIAVNL